jgi:O-antigen/teichoic acid export membrane protein
MIKKIIKFFWRNYFEEQRILKNSFWIAFSRFVSSALRAVLIIYSFRILGPSLQGSFSLAMNFILIFSFIPDFGLTAVLIRELVQNQERRKEILSNAVFSLLALMALSLIFIHLTKGVFIRDKLAINVIFILSLFLVFDTLREFLYAIFRAEEKMELQGISHILTNLLLLISGVIFLKENPTPINLSYAYLLAGFVGFAFTFFILRKEFMFNLFRFLKPKIALQLLNKSWPIGVANFLFLILTYIDSLIIGWFHGSRDVGLYNASVKISEFLYFFPAAIAMALFPIVSKKLKENKENLKETLSFAFQFAVFISFPIFIGIFVLAPEIINFLFGKEYLISHPALRLISFSIPINFFLLILLDMLIALDKRKELLFYDFLVVLVNFILNLIFVPEFSYFASSLITSISTFLSLIFAYLILRRYIEVPIKNIKFKNYLLSSLMIGGLMLILPASMNIVSKVFLGAITYFLILCLLKDELILDKIKFYLNAN